MIKAERLKEKSLENNSLNKFKNTLVKHETIFVLVMLFLIAFLTYGIHLDELGLYWDDWGVFWVEQHLGTQGVIDAHMIDRPLIGYNHAILSTLFGRNITYYHIYAFSLRLLGTYIFLWLIRMLWPDQRFFTTIMAILFLVYPGFLSQPIAYTKTNHLTAYLLLLISFSLIVKALKVESRFARFLLCGLSLLTGGMYYFYFEYLLGFELARIVLIGYVIWQGSETEIKKKIVKFIIFVLPFVIVAGVYFYWRVYIFESSRASVDVTSLIRTYFGSGARLSQYMSLASNLLIDYFELIILAWLMPPHYFITHTSLSSLGSALLLGSIATGLVVAYFWVYSNRDRADEETTGPFKINKHWVILGLIFLILTNFLPVFAGREFGVLNIFKSYGLHISFSVSILLVGLFFTVIRSRINLVVIAFLILLATVTHNLNAVQMVDNWENQRELWWQLSWRAPDLEDGTILWIRLPNQFSYQQDYETWGPANFIFRDGAKRPRILAEILYGGTLSLLQQGDTKPDNFRKIWMKKDYGDSLVMSIPSSNSCLHVYDQNKLEFSKNTEPLVQLSAQYSKIEQVVLDSSGHVPPEEIFGPEPEHHWCYYYQKASLARQLGNWEEIIRLLEEADTYGYGANDPVELMPFLEAYVNLSRYDEALEIGEIIRTDEVVAAQLCNHLTEDPSYPGVYDYEKVDEILCHEASTD